MKTSKGMNVDHNERDFRTDRDARRSDALGIAGTLALVAVGVFAAVKLDPPQAVPAVRAATMNAAARATFDPSPYVLNALLVPVLDVDAEPLRFVDPRPVAGCGAATSVLVDGRPLVAGALVPYAPFELEWQADDCHPFGAAGPRLDGRMRLAVFHEAGLEAVVSMSTMRATFADGHSIEMAPPELSVRQDDAMAAAAHDAGVVGRN